MCKTFLLSFKNRSQNFPLLTPKMHYGPIFQPVIPETWQKCFYTTLYTVEARRVGVLWVTSSHQMTRPNRRLTRRESTLFFSRPSSVCPPLPPMSPPPPPRPPHFWHWARRTEEDFFRPSVRPRPSVCRVISKNVSSFALLSWRDHQSSRVAAEKVRERKQ